MSGLFQVCDWTSSLDCIQCTVQKMSCTRHSSKDELCRSQFKSLMGPCHSSTYKYDIFRNGVCYVTESELELRP
jgi:hypothetical protein